MPVYDKSGNVLPVIYDKSGNVLSQAYDKSGNPLLNYSTLKVMTYNVGQWYIGNGSRVPAEKKTEYYNLQTGIFASHTPDVLFMQEYLNSWCDDNSPTSDLLSDYFDNQEVTNPTGYIGHSICTNGITINSYTSHNFPTNKGNYPTYETAQITVDGKTINLINTHNDYVESYQTSEISTLLTAISGLEYFILCGDFNINLASVSTGASQYTINVKPFVDAGYNVGQCVKEWIPTYFSTSTATGGKYTDQVITSSNITINSLYADTTKLTDNISDKIDHIPLIAELIIT